jgi:hypothetical protein
MRKGFSTKWQEQKEKAEARVQTAEAQGQTAVERELELGDHASRRSY